MIFGFLYYAQAVFALFAFICLVDQLIKKTRNRDRRNNIVSILAGMASGFALSILAGFALMLSEPFDRLFALLAWSPRLDAVMSPSELDFIIRIYAGLVVILSAGCTAGKICAALLGRRGYPDITFLSSMLAPVLLVLQPYIGGILRGF